MYLAVLCYNIDTYFVDLKLETPSWKIKKICFTFFKFIFRVHSNLETCNEDRDLPATNSKNLSPESDTLAEPDIEINHTSNSQREKKYGKRKK